jgi:hypothetical protein
MVGFVYTYEIEHWPFGRASGGGSEGEMGWLTNVHSQNCHNESPPVQWIYANKNEKLSQKP